MWRRLWLFLTFVLVLGVGISVLRVYEDSMRTRERGELVVSIVREQMRTLGTRSAVLAMAQVKERTDLSYATSDGLWNPKRWLIRQVFEAPRDPSHIASLLKTWLHAHSATAIARMSMDRWSKTLELWSTQPSSNEQGIEGLSPEQLLSEGRLRFFEASGFHKIGKADDATVLDLWTIVLLTKFIEKNPFHSSVPEALFMLGDAYVYLGRALPSQVKADRVLNLCSELYPDSVWANRANLVWKEEFADAI
jgi:hypothetical protein